MLAAKNSFSIALEAVEEIGRQADETGLSKFHGQILGVLIDAVAFMENDHSWPFTLDLRQRAHRADSFAEADGRW